MYERLLDKSQQPCLRSIQEHLGPEVYARLTALEERLANSYALKKELRFPFGNSYGWGFKYLHKSAHLCYAFFEENAFTVTIQIGDAQSALLEKALDSFSPKARELWVNRYPCGKHGGWIHYRVLRDEDLNDVICFIHIKKAPPRTS